MRPRYETDADRVKEQHVASLLMGAWKLDMVRKFPDRLKVDYGLFRKKVLVAVAEVKCRTNASALYPTYMMSMDKYMATTEYEFFGVKAYLVVEWTDKIGFVRLMDFPKPEIGWGGRTDRDDPDDEEPVVYIPVSAFTELKKK